MSIKPTQPVIPSKDKKWCSVYLVGSGKYEIPPTTMNHFFGVEV